MTIYDWCGVYFLCAKIINQKKNMEGERWTCGVFQIQQSNHSMHSIVRISVISFKNLAKNCPMIWGIGWNLWNVKNLKCLIGATATLDLPKSNIKKYHQEANGLLFVFCLKYKLKTPELSEATMREGLGFSYRHRSPWWHRWLIPRVPWPGWQILHNKWPSMSSWIGWNPTSVIHVYLQWYA